MPDRRDFLQVLSTLPALGVFPPDANQRVAGAAGRDYFKELGVRPFLNAAGTYTVLTASLMRPEVVQAIAYASTVFVPLNDLHDAVARRLADLLHVEAAMVTSGAAAALTLGTAACITGKNPDWIRKVPELSDPAMKREVVIQKSHRYGYDHAVRNCGVRLIEVETSAELERAVSERTAMMLFFNDAAPKGAIGPEEFVALGRKHGVPTFNDAAADVPPTEHLMTYSTMGFDLVTFSGGKGLRGPQSAGLLLGRRDLIEAARMNASPNGDTIGRGLKVNKEEILGMLVAIEAYLERDAAAEWREWERRAQLVRDTAQRRTGVQSEIYVPPIANHVPHVRITWNRSEVGVTAADVRRRLREGEPAIEIVPGGSPAQDERQEISVGVWQLQDGEAEIVARRLEETLRP
jgi:D-glucosaminate-6-phosphate ammonia-lyase